MNPVEVLEYLVEEKHGAQLRQDGSSNALHVKRVRAILMSALTQSDELPEGQALECGALGHDLLEDTDVTEEELQQLVSPDALRFIKEMTNIEGDSHTEQYVRQLVSASEEARLIKYADLTDNTFHASYHAKGLGVEWMQSFFLPIIDPMREALRNTTFTRYPKTSVLLRSEAETAREHLGETLKNLP